MKKNCTLQTTTLIFIAAMDVAAAAAPAGVNLAKLEHWNIVTATDAVASEIFAAEEFQKFFLEASGLELPVVSQITRPDQHIFIGPGSLLAASNAGFCVDDFGDEDFRILVRNRNIAIAGGRPRGTLYGVYTFLEDYLGVRFLTLDHTHVPSVGQWRLVGPVDRFYHPPLAFRWSYYVETELDEAFAARVRCNTVPTSDKLGGRTDIGLINHSFLAHCPAGEYGQEHPEYFALVNGERKLSAEAQLCLSNPDVLKVVTNSVLQHLESNPRAGNISVSPNDNWDYCRCKTCVAVNHQEDARMGSLLPFVNQVADRIAEDFPRTKVGVLAYAYHRKRPKTIRPRANVMIQLCNIECCVMHAVNDPSCPRNVDFCRTMDDWGEVSEDIFIWSYNTNFNNYLLPCPNLRVIEPNIRYFVANQARGIFMQAAYTSGAAEFSDLKNYLTSGLLWDPNRSGQDLIDEFLQLHYGRAAPPIARFINLVQDRGLASGRHTNCFGRGHDYGIDESVGLAGVAAMQEALELAQSAVVQRRIEKLSLAAYRAAIEPVWYVEDPEPERPAGPREWYGGIAPENLDPELAARMRPLVQRFIELCDQFDVTATHEEKKYSYKAARGRLIRAVGLNPSF